MTWSQFLAWVLIAYLIYYAVHIINDLFISKNGQGGDDEAIYQLTHEEKVSTVDVQDLLNDSKKKNNSKTVVPSSVPSREEEVEKQEFVQTESTGGVSVKNLFSIYSGKAAVDTNSILWD